MRPRGSSTSEPDRLRREVAALKRSLSEGAHVEERLRLSEARFRLLVEHAADAFFLIDERGRFLDVNRRAGESLGYSREELLGMAVTDIDVKMSAERVTELLRRVVPGEPITVAGVHRRKDGSTFPVEVRVAASVEDGRRHWIALARDVGERERAEAAMRESEERYRDLYEHAPLAYITVGADGLIRMTNERAARMLGRSKAELIGRPVLDLYADTPAGKSRAEDVFRRFLAGEDLSDVELEMRRADGDPVWVSLTVRAMKDGRGRVVESRSMLVDVTERKRVERALRDSEQRFAGIFRSAMDAIIIVDLDRRISLFNEAAEIAFRCPASEAVGRSFDRFLSPEFRRVLEECLRGFAEGGTASSYLWSPGGLTAVRADGEEFAVEATVSRTVVGGEELCTIILRDVDDRKRAEAQLLRAQHEKMVLQEELEALSGFGTMVAGSAAMKAVFDAIGRVAATDSTVLVTGETGTGKELVARAIHSASRRRDKVLVKVNCAALPAGLIESELFGHEKGAFTGAVARKMGRFELADGGTIFLDEIGDLPLDLQAKLLRILQDGEFERVGGSHTLKVDVRVIAATNRELEPALREGRFRSDLFYRLNVFPINVPPLRERKDDIPLLARHFLRRYAAKMGKTIDALPPETLGRLLDYDWPGNVRELENVIERAVILSTGPELELGEPLGSAAVAGDADGDITTLDEAQRRHMLRVLEASGWRIRGEGGAAERLGLPPTTLESRMARLGIRRPDRRPRSDMP
jgi:PAS domain S-box-containing protein